MADNLRHTQYRDDGTQIDDPQKLVDDGTVSGDRIVAIGPDMTPRQMTVAVQTALDFVDAAGVL